MTTTNHIQFFLRIPVAAILLGLVSACTTMPEQTLQEEPARHAVKDVVRDDVNYAVDVYDPWEPMNRRIYNFNTKFDRYIFLPVVSAYEFVLPNFVEDGISNVFSNIGELENFINSVLQLKPEPTFTALGRFLINTTAGVAGLWDPATKMGIDEWDEDFGQTLGRYGVGDGPFLVLPIFGPSNLRDTAGLVADSAMFSAIDPFDFDDKNDDWEAPYYLLNAIDKRHRTAFRYYETGSPFEYELIRLLYGKARQLEISK
ncbi:MAG: VacJ family lipoprotein [Gammaproteobacteria bacterium]